MSFSKPLLKLLGNELCYRKREEIIVKPTAEILTSSVIGLYFAGLNATKEKDFSESLMNFQAKLEEKTKVSSAEPARLQIIMICYDQGDKTLSIPNIKSSFLFLSGEGASVRQSYLVRKYNVQDPPVLILMDGFSGKVLNFAAHEKIIDDPEGLDFPWRHKPLSDILADGPILLHDSNTPESFTAAPMEQDCNVQYIGYLFSAYWCPPCRSFLPVLKDAYHRLRSQGKMLEIVYVSSDRSEQSFKKFFAGMPWLAVPYEDEERRKSLTTALNIKSIPSLILTDSKDNIITSDGRIELNNDLEAWDFPWHPHPVIELQERHSSVLNNHVCMIFFTCGVDENEYDNAEASLLPIANEINESETEEAFQPKVFIATDSELSESLRICMELDESKPHLALLDIPNYRYVIAPEGVTLSEDSARDFLQRFESSELACRTFITNQPCP